MRTKARVDANHGEIVEAFRAMGASVLDLSRVGKGCPDLLVGWRGRNYLVEVKDGNKPPSRTKLTKDELLFFDTWKGQRGVVFDVDSAVGLLDGIIDADPATEYANAAKRYLSAIEAGVA